MRSINDFPEEDRNIFDKLRASGELSYEQTVKDLDKIQEYMDKQKEEHERECVPKIAEREALIKDWKARWPNFCKSCYGQGGFSVPASMWSPPDYDLCGECTDAEIPKCSRCSATLSEEDIDEDRPCAACGWDWGKGQDDICPPEYECQHMF